jgi:hypothetical protein
MTDKEKLKKRIEHLREDFNSAVHHSQCGMHACINGEPAWVLANRLRDELWRAERDLKKLEGEKE